MRVVQKLALFDLDDTLVDRRAAFNVWAEQFAAARGLGDRDVRFLVRTGAQHAGPMDGFFAMICEAFDLPDDPGELWRQYRRRMPELVSCRAADLDALRRLRAAGWHTGIVSNGMADNQLAKIRHTGLAELVDGWAISGEAGCRKPDPEIFRLAAARCGANRAPDGWVIGDNLTLDVAGGHAAGMHTIWLRPDARAWSFHGPAPNLVVDTVADAVDALLAQHDRRRHTRPDPGKP